MSMICGILYVSCDAGIISQPYPNKPPDTKLFIQGDTSGIDTTFSTQYLNWWGIDTDGEVMGYYYQWSYFATENPDSFIWTTSESDTFNLPIRQDVDHFWFKVKAVDNSAQWEYPEPTISVTLLLKTRIHLSGQLQNPTHLISQFDRMLIISGLK